MKRTPAVIGLLVVAVALGGLALARHPSASPPGDRTVTVAQGAAALAVDTRRGHTFVATAGPNGVHGQVAMLDTRTGALLRTSAVGSGLLVIDPRALAVDEQAGRVLAVNGDTTESVLDARSGRVLYTLTIGNGLATPLMMALDAQHGRAFVVGSGGAARLSVLAARSGRLLRTFTLDGFPQWVAVAPRAGRVFVAGAQAPGASTVTLDATIGRVLHAVAAGGPLVVDERSGHVFVANAAYYRTPSQPYSSGTVSVLDARGALVHTVRVGTNPSALALDPETRRVFVATGFGGSTHGKIKVLDARSGRIVRTITVGWNPAAIVVDARRRRVVVANAGFTDSHGNPAGFGSISVLDAGTGRVLRTVAVAGSPRLVAVDERAGRAVVVARALVPCPAQGSGRASGGILDALRSGLARLLAGNARPTPAPCGLVSRVTLLDTTR